MPDVEPTIDEQIEELTKQRDEIEQLLASGELSDEETQANNDLFQQLSGRISELKITRFMKTL